MTQKHNSGSPVPKWFPSGSRNRFKWFPQVVPPFRGGPLGTTMNCTGEHAKWFPAVANLPEAPITDVIHTIHGHAS